MPPPHHIWVSAGEDTTGFVLVLHGILGSGQNFRSLAQRMAEAHPCHGLALVDLRFHGRTGPRPGRQDLSAVADDLFELERSLPSRCVGVMGHSFGGKVASVFASRHPQGLQRVWILDSPPGARADAASSESTLRILDMLERAPRRWPDRRAFVEHVTAQGQSRAIGQWLAMNLSRSAEGGFELALDIGAIRTLLDDYFATDTWPWIERTRMPISLVLGAQSDVWSAAERARVDEVAAAHAHVQLRVVSDAAHWLHAENPDGTLEAILADWPDN